MKKYWKSQPIIFKILTILWTLYSLTSLTVLSIFQWIIVWFFGFLIFLYLPLKISHLVRKTPQNHSKDENSKTIYHDTIQNAKNSNSNQQAFKLQNTIDSTKSTENMYNNSIEKVLQMQKEFELEKMKEDYSNICKKLEKNNKEILNNVGKIILDTYLAFGIQILISNASIYANQVIFNIVPHEGIRIKTILNFKEDLSLRLGTNIEMEVFPKLGCIGVIIPIDYFTKEQDL